MEGEKHHRHREVPHVGETGEVEADNDKARLIGELVAEWIATLGEDVAYVDGGVVEITGESSGRPPRRSLVRPVEQLVHAENSRGIRS